MNSRLPLLLSACFLTGAAGGLIFIPRRAPQSQAAAASETPHPKPRAEEPRPEPTSEEDRAKLLHSLVIADGEKEWPADTQEALIRQLIADPAFIHAIWQDAPEGDRDKVIAFTFAALAKWCPAYIWRVVERVDFDLPNGPLSSSLIRALQAAPEDAHATLRLASSHLAPELLKNLVSYGANTPAFAAGLVSDALEGQEIDPTLWSHIAYALLTPGVTLPDGWEKLEGLQYWIEKDRESHRNRRAAFDWAAQGYPVDRLDGPDSKLAANISTLVQAGQIPPPAVYDALASKGDFGALGASLMTLATDSRAGDALKILNGMQKLPVGAALDAILLPVSNTINNETLDHLQALDFDSRITDPSARGTALQELFSIWITSDPEGARAALPRLDSEEMRAGFARKIDQTTTAPH